MGRLKNIAGKNEEKLEAIKDYGEKQLDATEKQNKNQLKPTKKDSKTKVIVYLEERIDKLFKIYPKYFNTKSKVVLEKLKLKENEVDYKNLFYKIYFSDKDNVVFHKTNFVKKYGTLYGLLEGLVTRKINIDNANVDQLSFIIKLMYGCNKNNLFDGKIQIKKSIY